MYIWLEYLLSVVDVQGQVDDLYTNLLKALDMVGFCVLFSIL